MDYIAAGLSLIPIENVAGIDLALYIIPLLAFTAFILIMVQPNLFGICLSYTLSTLHHPRLNHTDWR